METINGEWYMKGCDPHDPTCVHSLKDLVFLIREVGFLPLFSNSITGFSVEERTPADVWWTGDPASDPWEWRKLLAVMDDIAYGKFFDQKAGFIAKEWFPAFANYRRNGYDFDALYDDGFASFRAKKIMDTLDLDEQMCGRDLLSNDLKELAGFGKGGEKNFPGILTELQMQTYLILNDFRQRRNKRGEGYGWHIACVSTPETKWGYDFVSDGYREKPTESWERICRQITSYFPSADDKQLQKVLGIRYPGTEDRQSEMKPAKPKPERVRKLKPYEFPYPENLLREIGLELVFGEDNYTPLTDDQMAGLDYAIGLLKSAERTVLKLRYEDRLTWRKVGTTRERSPERVRQIAQRAIRKLRHPSRVMYIRLGMQGNTERLEQQRAAEEARLKISPPIDDPKALLEYLDDITVGGMGLSVRSYNCLSREGVKTAGQLYRAITNDSAWLKSIHNLGKNGQTEIICALQKLGVPHESGGQ